MSYQHVKFEISGSLPLLHNNPQSVDRFNPLTREIAKINAKKTRRTDDDYLRTRDLEVEVKTYWDKDLGVYVPDRWMMAAISRAAFSVAKVGKDKIRAALLFDQPRFKLNYKNHGRVSTLTDIVSDEFFRHVMILPQGQVRVVKAFPIFHEWNFGGEFEFDDTIIDFEGVQSTLDYAARIVGFGDFRPSFGRGEAKVKLI